jgi:hypothetical protein
MFVRLAAVLGLAVVVGACGERGRDMATVAEGGAPQDMAGMHDEGMMQRHAEEARAMGERMRGHIRDMRALPAAEWHDHAAHHAGEVAALLSLMTRHMREMDMGMGMGHDDGHMGEMMGHSAEEHAQMMEQMRLLREDTEALQVASAAEVRQRMPAHLERLERVVAMMEQAGEYMAGAGGGHGGH